MAATLTRCLIRAPVSSLELSLTNLKLVDQVLPPTLYKTSITNSPDGARHLLRIDGLVGVHEPAKVAIWVNNEGVVVADAAMPGKTWSISEAAAKHGKLVVRIE